MFLDWSSGNYWDIWDDEGSLSVTNASQSYLPPYDGWYTNGVLTDVTVEFFSGQLAGVESDKVDNNNGSATNLTAAGVFYQTGNSGTVRMWQYYTNSVAGVGTNGVWVKKFVTEAGTTNTYYSLYQ